MKAHDPAPLMQTTAVAGECSTQRKCLDISERRHAILSGHTRIILRSIVGLYGRTGTFLIARAGIVTCVMGPISSA